ncbi:DUF4286 family protein [Longispora albida]|uniref:DUF4286 family protein n=1 Tax=Longispora albida TaxID=203523 RepID=UPI00036E15C2|nr:DUF4286 family protein [Longispora albida]
MLIYAVRSEFTSPAERDRFLAWLHDGHVAAVVAAGATSGEVTVLDDGTVESRYVFASREAFAAYEAGPAAGLRADGASQFPEVKATRTVGERTYLA